LIRPIVRYALMALGACCVAPAAAQVAPGVSGTQAADERVREVERGAEAARRQAPPPSFEQLLAGISDPDVNLRYAEGQVAQGRLDLAAVTLERILLTRPDLDQVRLFYAAVLFRLDQLAEAEQEFRILQGRPLPPEQRAEVERYLKLIAESRKPLKQAITVSAGLHYDNNRNAYPRKSQFDVLNVRVRGAGEEEDDIGKLLIGTYEFRYDTGLQRTQELFGNLSLYLDDQTEIDELDTRAALMEIGLRHRADFATLIPSVFLNYIDLENRKYVSDRGVRLRGERPVTDKFLAYVEGTIGYEKFSDTNTLPFASEQTGRYLAGRAGGRYALSPRLALEGWYEYRDKNAVPYETYTSHEIGGRAVRTLPRRAFVTFDASVERQSYEDPDPFVSNAERADTDWSVGATYGQPFGELVSYATDAALPEGWSDVIVSLSGEYQRTHSNIPNYDYDNWRAQVLFTKRFSF
jgi:hypothetical protein